jgi:hypothetical protein
MTDAFSAPAAGGRFNAESSNGKLLLIRPDEYKTGISTSYGVKDAISANIVVIDEKAVTESEEIDGALLFGGVLIGQLKSKIGQGLVLGRLEQGTAKVGQKPPWRLADPTDAEKDIARAYLASTAPQL